VGWAKTDLFDELFFLHVKLEHSVVVTVNISLYFLFSSIGWFNFRICNDNSVEVAILFTDEVLVNHGELTLEFIHNIASHRLSIQIKNHLFDLSGDSNLALIKVF